MRKLSISVVVLGVLVAAAPAFAQQTPPPTPSVGSQQTPPPPAPGRQQGEPILQPRAPALPGITANVKLDLTITDTYTGTPVKKTVSMLVLNGSNGMIRTSNVLAGSRVGLNVDAAVMIHQGGLVTLRITFEYTPAQTGNPDVAERQGVGQPASRPAELHESLSVILQDGKPLLVSQSADPASDRKVTVEIVATVLK